MTIVAGLLGAAVALINAGLAAARKLPTTGIGSGGYGVIIWSAVTGLYAAGVSMAVLPPPIAAAAAPIALGSAAVFVFGRSVWVPVTVALAGSIGAIAWALSLVSRWLTAGVVFVSIAVVVLLVALPKLHGDPGFAGRLRDVVGNRLGRASWTTALAGAAGATAALPAAPAGTLLMTAAVAAAVGLAVRADFMAPALIALAATGAVLPAALALVPENRSAGWWTLFAAAALALVYAVSVSLRVVLRELFGPFQREYPGNRAHPATIRWVWTGAVTDTSATIVVRPADATPVASLTLTLDGAAVITADRIDGVVARFELTGLEPDARHVVRIAVDDAPATEVTFRTFGGHGPIRIAVGSCASTGSNGLVFDRIAELEPHVFCQLGDLHYENIDASDIEPYRRAFDAALSTPAVTSLMSRVPMTYVYDDHDFGRNNSNRTSRSIPTVWENYRQLVPHHELATDDGPVHQRFTIGPVLVVISDTRAERDPTWKEGRRPPDGATRCLIGPDQERWLLDAPRVARELGCSVVLWCNPTPWLGHDGADTDTWTGYPEQRRRIANGLAEGEREHGVRIVVVSGDAHMIGLDTGTADRHCLPVPEDPGAQDDEDGHGVNAAQDWQARIFPAMNAASLDRRGSHKGAHYGEFEQIGAGQFGIVTVDRSEGEVSALRMDVYDQHGHAHGMDIPLPAD